MKKWSIAIPILVLAVAIFLIFAIRGHWDSWKSNAALQKTNDAYVTGDQIPLSTRVSGTVQRVGVQDYQLVKAGQSIVELDNSDYQASVDEAQAAISAAHAELTANQDAKRAADANIDAAQASVEQAQAAADAAQAGIDASQAQVTQSVSEYQRQETLLASRAATRQQFEQVQEARDAAQAALQSRRADLVRTKAAVASSRAALAGALQQRAALNAKDAGLQAQIAAKTAGVTIAQVSLAYTKITAPADGRVGRLRVHPGQLVGAGVQVVDFVQDGAWVEANFLETQLAHVRVGDTADIKIDAYPSQILHGHVSEIAPASGSATALLPPDNATGNFTKVVQRVPVKILFDGKPSGDILRPGLSAEVTVHTDPQETTEATPSATAH
ncbi:HlyD family secretion protein [Tunturibacter empetritectus]|uniref:Membrane fusion protein (Multidrug efflux system) n=1 Tax=Tunturiibacter empetritectus TaxID=3069691 RepID=A0A7W8MUG0_9BACT|nr:HlyD family secretion protein [Edaphobacter lichenicola]MBB5319259.1 membrane fusion protein (multidrug efflux system) [Edaphobacter lichenicola]